MRQSIALALTVWLLNCAPALSWGSQGHQIIARIAASELTPKVSAAVADLLGGEALSSMIAASTYADEIRSTRRETAPWHYVNIEIDSNGYNAARDCPNDDCVVGQLQRDVAMLNDASLAKPVRAEALRFLIHFIGDETQPLHCSDNHDRGGNNVRVVLNGAQTNLHSVWDTEVVEALGNDTAKVAAHLLATITPAEKVAWSSGMPVSWAIECWRMAKQDIYADLPGSGGTGAPIALPPDYARKKSPIAAEQLQRAGVRLALILNSLLK